MVIFGITTIIMIMMVILILIIVIIKIILDIHLICLLLDPNTHVLSTHVFLPTTDGFVSK